MAIVSLKVSPLERELLSKFIFIILCPIFFAANSKLTVVLVEGSKKRLKIFLTFDFLVFFLFNENLMASSAILLISFMLKSSMEVIFLIIFIIMI